jgi:hypothetical protein
MTTNLSQKLPTDPDLLGSIDAIQRAAEAARKLAIQTGTPLIIYHDGKIIDALKEERSEKE